MLEKIRDLCQRKGISLAQLEQECGLSNKALYRWDEQMPSVDRVKRVADRLGVTIDYLLSDEEYTDRDELLEKAFADNPDMRILFKVSEKCSPAEIKTAIRLIQALRGESEYEDI